MKYGYFDEERHEYVITTPKTPVKWINYIGTLAFGGFVDQTGGALLCKGDPALNRITKYIPQLPAADFRGETLYLRVREVGGYRLVAPYFTPCLSPYTRYECRVGQGVSTFVFENGELRVVTRVFVPQGAPCEVRDVEITNLAGRPLTLDAIPVVEYSHFDALKQFTNADWVPQTMQSRWVQDAERGVLLQYAFMKKDTAVNFFTASCPSSSFESDRKRFLGDNEYGTWAHPLSLDGDELSNGEALRGDNIGALMLHLGSLQPNESRRFVTLLGQVAQASEALELLGRYSSAVQVEAALAEIKAFWAAYFDKQQVQTPDAAFNAMLNTHNPHQCYITKNWSRDLSLYQLGFGGRGIGFRDSSQDVMGVLAQAPGEAKALMRKLLSVQTPAGSAMHQFYASTMEANAGDSREVPNAPHYYSDDHLWMVLAVCAYLKETGDFAFLREELPFYEEGLAAEKRQRGSVMEHIRRGLEFTWRDVGAHGLPLLGFADWNDTVNLPRGAESLFTAHLFGAALREWIGLLGYLGDEDAARHYEAYYQEMRARVEQHAWDGAWYVRYFDAQGSPLGSAKNQYGQIFLNGQSWAVLSGFASAERAEQALQSVRERLNTPRGVKLSAPGYTGFDPRLGGVSTYPPGAKENGGIFLHSNPWLVIAETRLGHGDQAYEYYRQINPAAKNDELDGYECEPYVYPQNVLGDEHPQFGLARNTWLSGTASWMYQSATKHILGIQPDYDGLRIDPCIPAEWDGFSVRREFRGCRYEIRVKNPRGLHRGVTHLLVDGARIEGNQAPIFQDSNVHIIEASLGA